MSDPTPPTAPVETKIPQTRGYFNQAQLDDIALGESVLAAATANKPALADRDIDEAFLTRTTDLTGEARLRASRAASESDDSEEATLASSKTAAALYTALQGIQSAAKQKHRMLAIDGDPATNFSTAGYLIGSRLNGSRANLLQNAATLITRITEDSLPGYKTPAAIKAVEDLLTAFREDKAAQQETTRTKETARLDRDELIELLNNHRSAIQHAADAIWPWSNEANRPTRKTFALPLTRPLGM